MTEKKKRIENKRYLLPVYILLLFIMFILPYYSAEEYSILKNTTSQLGAQHAPNAWIMNITFCLLGIACMLEAWIYLKTFWVHKILLTIFGTGLILTAVFRHEPIIEGIPYNDFESALHSLFATIVGFSFTLFAISAAFIEKRNSKKLLAVLVGLIATGLSVLMITVTDYTGIWQRLIFIISFAWLMLFFEGLKNRNTIDISTTH
ncbi:MAG: DUF998 domain-containing protein [bacterium]|nr:DUF998 domain-containing protein [bacterium]